MKEVKNPGMFIKISRWQRFKWWLGIGVYKIQRHQTVDLGYSRLKQETLDKLYKMVVDKTQEALMPPHPRKDNNEI